MTWLLVDPDELAAGPLVLGKTHYLGRVLRARPGDEVTLFDGAGHFAAATIERIDKKSIALTVATPAKQARPAGRLIAEIALVKGDRLDFAVQKLTEIGIDRITLLDTEHSVVQWPPDRIDAKLRRLKEIAAAAAAQSRRAYVPAIEGPSSVGGAAPGTGRCLAFTCAAGGEAIGKALRGVGEGDTVRFAIGPEGDFSAAELDLLRAAGYRAVTLGPAVLRAETAAVAAAALCSFVIGRMG